MHYLVTEFNLLRKKEAHYNPQKRISVKAMYLKHSATEPLTLHEGVVQILANMLPISW